MKLLVRTTDAGDPGHYVIPPEGSKSLPPAVTAEQAIGDLPAVDARRQLAAGDLKRGARRFDVPLAHATHDNSSAYARLMRTWPGFAAGPTLGDHVIRYLPRDYPLFARLKPGDQYPEAFACAEKMFEEKLSALKSCGQAPRKNSPAWKILRASIVPPYDAGKFPNKWRKMESDRPARTLLAHLRKDGYKAETVSKRKSFSTTRSQVAPAFRANSLGVAPSCFKGPCN